MDFLLAQLDFESAGNHLPDDSEKWSSGYIEVKSLSKNSGKESVKFSNIGALLQAQLNFIALLRNYFGNTFRDLSEFNAYKEEKRYKDPTVELYATRIVNGEETTEKISLSLKHLIGNNGIYPLVNITSTEKGGTQHVYARALERYLTARKVTDGLSKKAQDGDMKITKKDVLFFAFNDDHEKIGYQKAATAFVHHSETVFDRVSVAMLTAMGHVDADGFIEVGGDFITRAVGKAETGAKKAVAALESRFQTNKTKDTFRRDYKWGNGKEIVLEGRGIRIYQIKEYGPLVYLFIRNWRTGEKNIEDRIDSTVIVKYTKDIRDAKRGSQPFTDMATDVVKYSAILRGDSRTNDVEISVGNNVKNNLPPDVSGAIKASLTAIIEKQKEDMPKLEKNFKQLGADNTTEYTLLDSIRENILKSLQPFPATAEAFDEEGDEFDYADLF